MKKILIVGATGNLGPHLVKELTARGHQVSALIRTESIHNAEKMTPLREAGVNMIEGDLSNSDSLLKACKNQEVVISAVGGGQIMQQVELAKAAKSVGVERFIPSEFGVDPIAAGPGSCDLFDAKAAAYEQIKATGIPCTPIYTNGFMEFWATGLGQLGHFTPPSSVQVFGDGNTPAYMVSLPDIARYVQAIIEDPSTLNQEIIIQGPNKITQNELIQTWESLSGNTVDTKKVSADELDQIINSSNTPETMMQRIFTQLHRSLWIKGESTIIRPSVLNASEIYPDIHPISVKDYLNYFL